jgi:hypothetical protein
LPLHEEYHAIDANNLQQFLMRNTWLGMVVSFARQFSPLSIMFHFTYDNQILRPLVDPSAALSSTCFIIYNLLLFASTWIQSGFILLF